MRGSRVGRAVLTVIGVWSTVVLNDSGFAHACSTGLAHEPRARVAAETTPIVRLADTHAHHAASSMPAVDETSSNAPHHPADHVPADCSCIGHCCVTDLTTIPHVADASLVLIPSITTVPPGRPAHDVVAAWVDFVLPFSTAPPRNMV